MPGIVEWAGLTGSILPVSSFPDPTPGVISFVYSLMCCEEVTPSLIRQAASTLRCAGKCAATRASAQHTRFICWICFAPDERRGKMCPLV